MTKTFALAAMKRTPKGVYCELEATDGRGWLSVYLDDPRCLLSFDVPYDVELKELESIAVLAQCRSDW